MRKAWLLITVIFLASIITLYAKADWSIDKTLKFQIGYLPTEHLLSLSGKNIINVPSLNLTPVYKPDIDNINLKSLSALGFQVPLNKDASKYTFYLKLYKFPENFTAKNTTDQILSDYDLSSLPNSNILKRYLSSNSNIYVKLGFIAKSNTKFSKSNPYPAFQVEKGSSFQNIFDEHLPFYSLYLTPSKNKSFTNNDEKAKYSANGVKAFYSELLASYRKNLKEVKGTDKSMLYFLAPQQTNKQLTIISIPKEITVFNNWKELPMPQDPNKVFLSSLLLVNHTTYLLNDVSLIKKPENIVIGSKKFNDAIVDKITKILEVGSVVYI